MLKHKIITTSKKIVSSLDSDIQAKLDSYNVAFSAPSTIGSAGSMPIGNGDITLNVWTEVNGDLLFYIGKSDTWSEATRLLKLGRVRVKITPNPFATDHQFSQILKLRQGEILITAGPVGQQVTLRAWVDAYQPVIRVEATGEQPFQIEATTEIWRDTVISMNDSTKHSYYGIASSGLTPNPSESADQVLPRTNEILWYHRNNTSLYYQKTLDAQHLGDLVSTHPDPYVNSTFGAIMKGTNMVSISNTTLRSSSNGTNFVLSVYPYTATTNTVDTWESQLNTIITNIEATDIATARNNHINWWDSFWGRSWVFVTGDADATIVTRGYLLQRFMEAIQGRGKYPIKFNGGTINFDFEDQNADYRLWGPPIWWQNTRLLYWPMLASGDYDMMLPLFNMYKKMLNLQMDVTKHYYNHEGAFFPEVTNFYGLSNIDNFQHNSPIPNPTNEAKNPHIKYYWQGGIELSAMMLEYFEYTKDHAFASNTLIPIAEQVVKFYDQHYPRENGIIKINPAQILETYGTDVANPTPELAGLRAILPKLLALPTTITTQAQRDEWQNCLNALPPIPLGTNANSETIIKPAESYSTANRTNEENGDQYAIFPYKIYGLGKPDLDIAIRSFNEREFQTGATITDCWHYDSILAAYLGLTAKAKEEMIIKFKSYSSLTDFPAFWNKMDWIPDLDNGAVAMNALQTMILQNNNNEIRILPSWPSSWNVDFKLHATGNTTVRGKYENGEITLLQATPADRLVDVIYPVKTARSR
ncbi:DUF5703 domain-containing protein [Paenibacillus roseipurpureus]|uniref:DUF5703 domain-containing protein n=1 Tax=Paenibacillus roseopurpureus TaxID=2918901 RepID=A0AA96RH09_9BACL|nr:DUF5703 domain-containing protein [Paenibacillus sp. MBLB1832]WNR42783.1 DUF5703 domain-containing protein [Paenibacillus sp. MBLB1832]